MPPEDRKPSGVMAGAAMTPRMMADIRIREVENGFIVVVQKGYLNPAEFVFGDEDITAISEVVEREIIKNKRNK